MYLKDNKNWKTHDWDNKSPSGGGHAVVIIGYDDATQRFLVQNSWGPNWADGGFFGFPYQYFGDWTVVQGAYTAIDFTFTWPTPVPGYVKKAYADDRKNAIKSYVNQNIQPIRDAASLYQVPADEIDYAMNWPEGTWNILKKV